MKAVFLFLSFYFISQNLSSQSHKDIYIQDSIIKQSHTISYDNLKYRVNFLNETYSQVPEIMLFMLPRSYENNDIKYFKKLLESLVKSYGFSIENIDKNSSYYVDLMHGSLSKWFKRMYINNHSKWLKQNLSKQRDLNTLNQIKDKDQLLIEFATNLKNRGTNGIINESDVDDVLEETLFNISLDFYDIVRTWGNYPTGENFAIVQNNFYILEIHNLKSKSYGEKYWKLFYPYYKNAYLNNHITNVIFKDYDITSYLNYGTQRFGLLKIEDVPKVLRKGESIPVQDLDFLNEIKVEFNWN